MLKFPKYSVVLLLLVASATLSACLEEETPQGNKRTVRRALPSVSGDHYSEVLSDGTYKYAYTGEHRYVAERRLADGTIEGESLFVRPDGVPVKVHYFADKDGYRPKTEVLYKERLGVVRSSYSPSYAREVIVPARPREVIVPAPAPAVVLAPPTTGSNSVNVNLGGGGQSFRSGGGDINVNTRGGPSFRSVASAYGQSAGNVNVDTFGGDVAAASPSVTAIVGPGGQAIVRPEAHARTSGGSKFFRTASGLASGGSGDVAIANPHTTAIVGPGGSVLVEPKATAFVGGGQPEVVREVHHHTQNIVRTVPHVERVVERVPVPVHTVHTQVPSGGYVYDAPRPVVVAPPPSVAVRNSGVILVPPSSRYSYSYGYSAPDPKHPQRDNSAYVNVNVNH